MALSLRSQLRHNLDSRNPGFALPTILIASVVMLTVLLISVTSTTAVRTAMFNQYYSQLAQAAGEAGVEYAKACLQANANVPTWSDAKPLMPNTDCSGNVQGSYPSYVMISGNIRSGFSLSAPTLDANGKAKTIPNNGYVEITRTSTGTVWRRYNQPSAQAAVVPDLCSGATTAALGWNNAVIDDTATYPFPESTAKYIAIGSTSPNPGPMYFRKDFSITQAGTYVLNNMGDDRSDAYIDGRLVSSVTWSSVDTQTVNLDVGCHSVVAKVTNTGILPNPSRLRFSLKLTGNSVPLLVSDTSWRVAAGAQATFSTVNYYQSSSWTSAKDLGAAVKASVMVVAGGGGGGSSYSGNGGGGGGGGGGVIYNAAYIISGSVSVTVGSGGSGGASNGSQNGSNGSNSVFGTLVAVGGGGGGNGNEVNSNAGLSGGSGGGTGYNGYAIDTIGSGTVGQGYSGGQNGATSGAGAGGGGGGGHAGYAPTNSPLHNGGTGGVGVSNGITGVSVYYGNGGNGGSGSSSSAVSGTAGTGDGGSGAYANHAAAGAGGSGVVIISYPTGLLTATGGTITTYGGNTIHTFTNSGVFSVTDSARNISTTHSYDSPGYYPNNSYAMFRDGQAITVTEPTEVKLLYQCDDSCDIYLDGTKIGSGGISTIYTTTLTLTEGVHKFGVTLGNGAGPSMFVFSAVRISDGVTLSRSDATWTATNAWYTTPLNPTSYDISYTPSPLVAVRGLNIAPPFYLWTLYGGASLSPSGILTLTSAGSAVSPLVPVDSARLIAPGADYYAAQPSPYATFIPNAGYLASIGYYGADGVTFVTNSANYTGNGCANQFTRSVWSTNAAACGWYGGPNVKYIRYYYFGSSFGYASPDLIIKNPTLLLAD